MTYMYYNNTIMIEYHDNIINYIRNIMLLYSIVFNVIDVITFLVS